MHFNRIATFLLGAWLFGSVFAAFVATQNFAAAERVATSPPTESGKTIKTVGIDKGRQLLRYAAGEANRSFLEPWELVELFLGVVIPLLFLVPLRNRALAGFAAALLLLTVFQHFKITPELVAIGRSNEFLAINSQAVESKQFYKLHTVYAGIEVLKIVIMLGIAGYLFPMRGARKRKRIQVNTVDHADHSHING